MAFIRIWDKCIEYIIFCDENNLISFLVQLNSHLIHTNVFITSERETSLEIRIYKFHVENKNKYHVDDCIKKIYKQLT